MKELIYLIVLCVLLSSCTAQPLDIIETAPQKVDNVSPSESATTEMAETPPILRQEVGFDSPEDAVWEYLEGLKNHDLNRMTSTFVIDTYVQHYDFESYLKLMGLDREGAEILNVAPPTAETRLHEITSSIFYQHWFLHASEFGEIDFLNFANETIVEEMSSFFIEHWSTTPDISLFSTGTLIGFIPPEMLIVDEQRRQYVLNDQLFRGNIVDYTDMPYDEITRGVRQHKHTGADKYENIVAVVEFSGNLHMIFVVALAYGDRWYLESFGGNICHVLFVTPQLFSAFFPIEWFISESELGAIMISA